MDLDKGKEKERQQKMLCQLSISPKEIAPLGGYLSSLYNAKTPKGSVSPPASTMETGEKRT